MAKKQVLADGNGFPFVSHTLTVLGVDLDSCTQFSIEITQEKKGNPGMSSEIVSYGSGAKEITGSMDISAKDMNKLAIFSPTGLLTDLPPQPGTLIANNNAGDKAGWAWTHMLFSSDGVSIGDGDMESMFTVNFMVAGLKRLPI